MHRMFFFFYHIIVTAVTETQQYHYIISKSQIKDENDRNIVFMLNRDNK